MMKIIPPLAEHTKQAGVCRRGIVAAIEKMLPLCERLGGKEND